MAGKICLFEIEPQYIRDVYIDPELEEKERILSLPVKEIELSVRASNCLEAANIKTIGDLVSKTEQEMLKYRNFGKKSLEEIVQKLKKYDLHLGMDVEEIYRQIREARSRGIKADEIPPIKEEEAIKTVTPPRKPVPTSKKKVKNAT